MGDRELVIKIPEEIYNYVQHIGSINMLDTQQVANAIINGTLLAKGHGRLIDADYKVSSDGRTIDAVCGYMAPTIIEADREVER